MSINPLANYKEFKFKVPDSELCVAGIRPLATGCWNLIPCFLPEASSEKPVAKIPNTRLHARLKPDN
jgi:hypothetical protein